MPLAGAPHHPHYYILAAETMPFDLMWSFQAGRPSAGEVRPPQVQAQQADSDPLRGLNIFIHLPLKSPTEEIEGLLLARSACLSLVLGHAKPRVQGAIIVHMSDF